MVSIVDVALRAGVSPTTVSHALSGRRKVSAEVHSKVLQAAAALHYTPSRFAQSLAQGRTKILGLVVPDINNTFFAQLAQGVERTAIASGYNVLLSTTGFDHTREAYALEMIRSKAVDGIIYAAGAPPSTAELVRLSAEVPMVLVDEELPGVQLPSFVSNNQEGGKLAADHLVALGHNRALILDAGSSLASSQLRVKGFQGRWLSDSSKSVVRATGGFTYEGGGQAIRPLLEDIRRADITAVFATNDLMALGAIEEMRHAGIRVPSQVSVVGFDDTVMGFVVRPGLTTVRQDVLGMGEAAVEWLLNVLGSGSKPQARLASAGRRMLPVELIVRGTTSQRRGFDRAPMSGKAV
jgi:DNA-binding LacI/PurR family transcriptional regulator